MLSALTLRKHCTDIWRENFQCKQSKANISKKTNWLQQIDLPDTSKISLSPERWSSTSAPVALAEWVFTADVLTVHTLWPVNCMRPTAACWMAYDPFSICFAGRAPSVREAPDVLHCSSYMCNRKLIHHCKSNKQSRHNPEHAKMGYLCFCARVRAILAL